VRAEKACVPVVQHFLARATLAQQKYWISTLATNAACARIFFMAGLAATKKYVVAQFFYIPA